MREILKIKDQTDAIGALLGAEGKIEMMRALFDAWAHGEKGKVGDLTADVEHFQTAAYGMWRVAGEVAEQIRAIHNFIAE